MLSSLAPCFSLFKEGVRHLNADAEMVHKSHCKDLYQFWSFQGFSYNKSIEQALVEGVFVSNSLDLLRNNEKALFLLGFPIW